MRMKKSRKEGKERRGKSGPGIIGPPKKPVGRILGRRGGRVGPQSQNKKAVPKSQGGKKNIKISVGWKKEDKFNWKKG